MHPGEGRPRRTPAGGEPGGPATGETRVEEGGVAGRPEEQLLLLLARKDVLEGRGGGEVSEAGRPVKG